MNFDTQDSKNAVLTQQEKKAIWVKWKQAGSWDNFLQSVKAQKEVEGVQTVIKYDNRDLEDYESKFIDPISGIDNYFEDKVVVFTREHKTAPKINTGFFIPRNYWDWCLGEMLHDPKFRDPFHKPFTSEEERLRAGARVKIAMEEAQSKMNPHREAKDAYIEKQKLKQAEFEERKAKILEEVRKEVESEK